MKGSQMARPDKSAAVAELVEDFRSAQATVLTEYRGLSVTSMKALRRSLGADTKYSVVKNTLTKIAAKEAGVSVPDELLKGPSAVAFIKGDPITAAKSLKNFQKENISFEFENIDYEYFESFVFEVFYEPYDLTLKDSLEFFFSELFDRVQGFLFTYKEAV
jgi:ribosomal protein L10